jgi:hypothetical protein
MTISLSLGGTVRHRPRTSLPSLHRQLSATLSAQIFADALQPVKGYLRKAGERTIPRLRRRIGLFARNLTARQAANLFQARRVQLNRSESGLVCVWELRLDYARQV